MLIVQTPVHSAPSQYLANMKTQINSPVKINGKTCLERCFTKLKSVIVFQSEILQAVDLECELVPLGILENQKQHVYLI